jgi:hypothetical protein
MPLHINVFWVRCSYVLSMECFMVHSPLFQQCCNGTDKLGFVLKPTHAWRKRCPDRAAEEEKKRLARMNHVVNALLCSDPKPIINSSSREGVIIYTDCTRIQLSALIITNPIGWCTYGDSASRKKNVCRVRATGQQATASTPDNMVLNELVIG